MDPGILLAHLPQSPKPPCFICHRQRFGGFDPRGEGMMGSFAVLRMTPFSLLDDNEATFVTLLPKLLFCVVGDKVTGEGYVCP